jgi:hypothetical protein
MQNTKTLEKRLCKVTHRGAGFVKEHFNFITLALHALRLIPTLPLFHYLWRGLLARMKEEGESAAAAWLQSYERPVPQRLLPPGKQEWAFVGWWSGLQGIFPGTGSGSEAVEAFHAPWQAAVEALKAKANLLTILPVMQQFCRSWESQLPWFGTCPVSPRLLGEDPQLLNGTALQRVGRSTAVDFHRAHTAGTTMHAVDGRVVAMAASVHKGPLAVEISAVGMTLISSAPASVEEALQRAGLLRAPREPTTAFTISLTAVHKVFRDIVYVLDRCRCTCLEFALHAVCEHVVFAQSLPSDGDVAARDLSNIPQRQKRGRPRLAPKAAAQEPRARGRPKKAVGA